MVTTKNDVCLCLCLCVKEKKSSFDYRRNEEKNKPTNGRKGLNKMCVDNFRHRAGKNVGQISSFPV